MGNIMTRAAIAKVLADENMTAEQRTEAIMGLYGRALDDGYISKTAAQTAQETALNNAKTEWEKGLPKYDPKASDEYKTLEGQFAAYKTMQAARGSDDFREVKPKFFETVYGMISRDEGAKAIKEQLADIRGQYEEYFNAPTNTAPKPAFGAPVQGSMPTGNQGAAAGFTNAWNFKK